MRDVFTDDDMLVMPTIRPSPRPDDFADYLMVLSRNVIPWSLIGFPAISMPAGRPHGPPDRRAARRRARRGHWSCSSPPAASSSGAAPAGEGCPWRRRRTSGTVRR